MTNRIAYETQVRDAEKRIVELEARHAKLEEQRGHLDVGRLVEAKHLRKEMDEIEGEGSDLKLLKSIAQEQLAKWKKNALPAETLRQQVAEMFEEGRSLVAQIMKAQEDVAGWLQDIEVINAKTGNLEGEHLKLIGEEMHAPPKIQVPVAMVFAWSNVPRIKNYDPWTYVSDDEYAAQAKAEREERRQNYEKLLKLANDNGPDCPRCARKDEAVKMQVDRNAGGRDTPGQGYLDGHWNLKCPKCGNRTDAVIAQTKRQRDQVVSIASGSVKPRTVVRHPDFTASRPETK
jgi:hypothetical protein